MSNEPHSRLLVENVNKIFKTFLPANDPRDSHQLYSTIGVDSFGTITFPDNKSNRAEFIRVEPNAPVTRVKELLTKLWCNGRPSLVISVTGGAKEYNMKPKLLRAFRRGLLKVARTTGAWIITGGMNTGIMKLVGEIVQINPDRSRPIHLIGIATWGCVSGFQQLDVHGCNVHYAQPRSEKKGEAPLEPNHTEFIFVDDGRVNKYGAEIAFRARLEQAISNGFFASKTTTGPNAQYSSLQVTPSLRLDNSEPVPVVLLVVEGGPNTVKTVHQSVVENNIPAVFLDGTGRCSDLFAKAYRLYNREFYSSHQSNEETTPVTDPEISDKRHAEFKNKLREEVKEELRRTLQGSADNPARVDTTDYFDLVYQCLQKRINFLNVITLNSRNPVEPDIDLVILQALLNATSGNDTSKTNIQRKREQLHLALEWNRVDIAKNYIMKTDKDWADIQLNDLFSSALDHGQIEFVKLFLDHDFSLTDLFRNNDKLLALYMNHVQEQHNFSRFPNDPLRTIYKEIIQPYIGDFFEIDAALQSTDLTSNHDVCIDHDETACGCCGTKRYQKKGNSDHSNNLQTQPSATHPSGLIDVDKELFLWSVITGKQDFALLFWSRGKNKICAALIAISIYRKQAREDNENNYNQYADEFENLAVQILNKFYQQDNHRCTKAIIRQIPAYGNITWLELAVVAEAKQFIAQKALQDILNNIWFGYIDQRVPVSKIIFSTIMIWYSGFLPYHKELVKTNDETKRDDKAKHKVYGIDNQTLQEKRGLARPSEAVQLRLLRCDPDLDDNTPVEFVPVGCWEKTKKKVIQYVSNITTFMRAPYVKYIYNLYFHVLFLLLFSYVILCDLFPLYDFPADVCTPVKEKNDIEDEYMKDAGDRKLLTHPTFFGNQSNNQHSIAYGLKRHNWPAITELILIVWVFTLFCEEIRQLFSIEAQSFKNTIAAYWQIFWNRLDVLAIVLFFIGIGLRFLPTAQCYCAARIILSVDLTIWFIRSLDIFAAVKRLGPKLVMIGEMAHDLKFFMLMLTVFILAFGVSSYSLIYGVQQFSWHIPRRIVNLAYWQIFGELNALDAFEHNYKANGYAAFILLVAYMAIVSILLVNLLIAMFSNTFDRLQTDTDRIWKFQRYSLVCEYLSRPSLPPPFILFSHGWRFILFICARYFKIGCMQRKYDRHLSRTKFKIIVDERKAKHIEMTEDAFGDEVYYNYAKSSRKLVDETDLDEERVRTPQENMLNKVRVLESRLQAVSNQQAHMFEYLECLMDGLKAMGGDRIRMPESRRFDDEPLNNGQDVTPSEGGASSYF